tara:strand:+ start:746 stop:925 length:180 start_codon:yes stop_codon:yes gene_type:complete
MTEREQAREQVQAQAQAQVQAQVQAQAQAWQAMVAPPATLAATLPSDGTVRGGALSGLG